MKTSKLLYYLQLKNNKIEEKKKTTKSWLKVYPEDMLQAGRTDRQNAEGINKQEPPGLSCGVTVPWVTVVAGTHTEA